MSCVESYLQAYLYYKEYNVPLLYCGSFIKAESVLMDREKFENFQGFERLQNILLSNGMMQYRVHFDDEVYDLTLAETSQEYRRGMKNSPWRSDHYVWLKKDGNESEYFDCYPVYRASLQQKNKNELFSGKRISYFLINFDEFALIKAGVKQLEAMAESYSRNIAIQSIEDAVNALLILKVSRERMCLWLEEFGKKTPFDLNRLKELCAEQYRDIAKLLVVCQRCRLRKQHEITSEISTAMARICKADEIIAKEAKKRRREHAKYI